MAARPLVFKYAGMLWCSCTLKKDMADWFTDKELPKGSKAYLPITNGKHRGKRLASPPEGAEFLDAR